MGGLFSPKRTFKWTKARVPADCTLVMATPTPVHVQPIRKLYVPVRACGTRQQTARLRQLPSVMTSKASHD